MTNAIAKVEGQTGNVKIIFSKNAYYHRTFIEECFNIVSKQLLVWNLPEKLLLRPLVITFFKKLERDSETCKATPDGNDSNSVALSIKQSYTLLQFHLHRKLLCSLFSS